MSAIKKIASIKSPVGNKIQESTFPVVAIGASAGGLEAMIELLINLPQDTGMAFIYVQHLSPNHKSKLCEILSKSTEMTVQEIDDMDKIKPNNVFVIPYNKGIAVTDGHIHLIPRSGSSKAISIDILFSSLARAQKSRVIGVVLSGSANDGTIGIGEIKSEGGLTFAQDDSAKFTSMPHSAIATGVIDFILSPKEIALELARLSKHPLKKYIQIESGHADLLENNDPDLAKILSHVLRLKGIDFSQYKMNTVKRRIMRRMTLNSKKSLKEYASFLDEKAEEIDILYQDLLINVTSFFRDSDSNKFLKETLLPAIAKGKVSGGVIRIWVPACATGEEAFSMAMMVHEMQETLEVDLTVQIFATDLSVSAIKKARSGVYNTHDLEAVTPKRIQRFFTKLDGDYRVSEVIRDMCVFAVHNILTDPPFSRLDFISCCNLFIYLDNAAQKKVLNTFHYALKENGYLMLGKSESINHADNHFKIIDREHKIFQSKLNEGSRILPLTATRSADAIRYLSSPQAALITKIQHQKSGNSKSLGNAIDAFLIAEFIPAAVVINYQMEIIQFRGVTETFLAHPKGMASFNVLKMVRQGMAYDLRNLISKSMKTGKRQHKSNIEFKFKKSIRIVSLDVVPLDLPMGDPLLLIVFSEINQADLPAVHPSDIKLNIDGKDLRIAKLEVELAAAQADAITYLEEQEAFAEDLQRANEEVVSSNEELQTLNEEQVTASEEIESVNEELITANQELHTRNDLLNEAYEYADAIVSTMHDPFIVLDKELRVKSANKIFYEKFGLTKAQTEGVFFYTLGNNQWNYPELRKLLDDILANNSKFDNFVVSHSYLHIGEKIMSLNASRIVQKMHREQLILLVIADITELRQLIMEKELRDKEILNNNLRQRNVEKVALQAAVAERTEELKEANLTLEEKNSELVHINKKLESFTYVSGHDLQEPLRKIQMFSDRILEKENHNLSDRGKNYFQIMKSAAQRMQILLHDLLDFSRISTAERVFEEADLREIIEEVTSELKEEINLKEAKIQIKNTCILKIIPYQFRQLIQNLISNSLKFAVSGRQPRVVIDSYFTDVGTKDFLLPNQRYCCISISDNGIGFENEFAQKIFEVFQKLHGKEEYAGTGIGLAIVKNIVENHNGFIVARGEINKGATFEIYIPV